MRVLKRSGEVVMRGSYDGAFMFDGNNRECMLPVGGEHYVVVESEVEAHALIAALVSAYVARYLSALDVQRIIQRFVSGR